MKKKIQRETPKSFGPSSKRWCECASNREKEKETERENMREQERWRERESQWGTTLTSNAYRLTLHPSSQQHVVSLKSQKPISESELSFGGSRWGYGSIVWIQSLMGKYSWKLNSHTVQYDGPAVLNGSVLVWRQQASNTSTNVIQRRLRKREPRLFIVSSRGKDQSRPADIEKSADTEGPWSWSWD